MNEKFVPYEKLQKKKRRALDAAKRGSWGAVDPVTRRAKRSDAYDRTQENRRWQADLRKGTDASGGYLMCPRQIVVCRFPLPTLSTWIYTSMYSTPFCVNTCSKHASTSRWTLSLKPFAPR